MSKPPPIKYFVTSDASLINGMEEFSEGPDLYDNFEDAAGRCRTESEDYGGECFVAEVRLIARAVRGRVRFSKIAAQ